MRVVQHLLLILEACLIWEILQGAAGKDSEEMSNTSFPLPFPPATSPALKTGREELWAVASTALCLHFLICKVEKNRLSI